jgi:hypothetical protein
MCTSAPKPPPAQPPPSQPPVIVESTPEVKTGGSTGDSKKRKKVASKNLRVPISGTKTPSSGVGV